MFTNLLGWLVTAPKIAGISRNWLLNLVHHTISPFQGTSFFDGTFQGTSESSNLNHPIKLPRLYIFLCVLSDLKTGFLFQIFYICRKAEMTCLQSLKISYRGLFDLSSIFCHVFRLYSQLIIRFSPFLFKYYWRGKEGRVSKATGADLYGRMADFLREKNIVP